MGKKFYILVMLVPLMCTFSVSALCAEVVSVWTYHVDPPFVVDEQKKTGLSFDLAKLLTEHSEGKYQFHVEILPRVRVDERLSSGTPGILIWVNNAWFGDDDRNRYLWSSAIFRDKNAVISPVSNPIEYENALSLIGKDLVGVNGHHYQDVDALVDKGEISRLDVTTNKAAMLSIASGHTDVSILANSTAAYYSKKLALEDEIHYSSNPHSRYQRYILVQPQLQPVFDFIEEFASEAADSAKWRALLDSYKLNLE